jgi:hypothetical protein
MLLFIAMQVTSDELSSRLSSDQWESFTINPQPELRRTL